MANFVPNRRGFSWAHCRLNTSRLDSTLERGGEGENLGRLPNSRTKVHQTPNGKKNIGLSLGKGGVCAVCLYFFRILKSRRSRFRAGQRLDLNLFSTHLPCFPKKEKEKKTQPKKGIAKEGRHRREKIRERSVRAKFYFLSQFPKK